MSKLSTALTGVSGILVTPFDPAGDLAPGRQGPIIDQAIEAGVHVLTVNGNTGEFFGLTLDEAERMVAATAEHVAGRVPVVAGVGRGLRDAARLARASVAAGADAIMVHQPADPFVAPQGLLAYVSAVAEAAGDLPLILYLRNDSIGVDAIAALCALPTVIAVKWATPHPMALKAAMAASPDRLIWVGGLAEPWAPSFYAVGARGFTSGLINVWPAHSVAISAALEAGDYAQARDLIAQMQIFEDLRAEDQGGANVSVVKAALALRGQACGAARPPAVWPLAEGQHRRLTAFLNSAGVLAQTHHQTEGTP